MLKLQQRRIAQEMVYRGVSGCQILNNELHRWDSITVQTQWGQWVYWPDSMRYAYVVPEAPPDEGMMERRTGSLVAAWSEMLSFLRRQERDRLLHDEGWLAMHELNEGPFGVRYRWESGEPPIATSEWTLTARRYDFPQAGEIVQEGGSVYHVLGGQLQDNGDYLLPIDVPARSNLWLQSIPDETVRVVIPSWRRGVTLYATRRLNDYTETWQQDTSDHSIEYDMHDRLYWQGQQYRATNADGTPRVRMDSEDSILFLIPTGRE